MKLSILLGLLFFISFLSKGQENIKKLLYNDPYSVQKYIDEQRDTTYILNLKEKMNGKVIVYYDSSFTRKTIESNYKDGKKNGVCTSWHRNGVVQSIENYKDGIVHGSSTQWNVLGIKLFEGNYSNGTQDGYFKNWYGNGVLNKVRFYNMGILDGYLREYYINGKRKLTEFYTSSFGEKDGTDSAWYENGNIGHEKQYKMGISEGTHTLYYENGGKKLQMTFKSNKMEGPVTEWDTEGRLFHIVTFKDDYPVKEERFYENGQKMRVVTFKPNSSTPDKWTCWNKKGNEIDRKDAPFIEGDYVFPEKNSSIK